MEQGTALHQDTVMQLITIMNRAISGTPADRPLHERVRIALDALPLNVVQGVRDCATDLAVLADARLTEGAPGE